MPRPCHSGFHKHAITCLLFGFRCILHLSCIFQNSLNSHMFSWYSPDALSLSLSLQIRWKQSRSQCHKRCVVLLGFRPAHLTLLISVSGLLLALSLPQAFFRWRETAGHTTPLKVIFHFQSLSYKKDICYRDRCLFLIGKWKICFRGVVAITT